MTGEAKKPGRPLASTAGRLEEDEAEWPRSRRVMEEEFEKPADAFRVPATGVKCKQNLCEMFWYGRAARGGYLNVLTAKMSPAA